MRLKSPFKDYYDGLQSMDLESEPLFLRQTREEYTKQHLLSPYFQMSANRNGTLPLDAALIGFAGKVYPVLRHTKQAKPGPDDNVNTPLEVVRKHFYSYEEVVTWATPQLKKRDLEDHYNPLRPEKGEVACFFNGHLPAWHYPYGKEANHLKTAAAKYFETYNVPIFIIEPAKSYQDGGDRITLNPRLKGWDFARIVPPYEAWRDLTVYWGSRAQPNKPIPEVSDADMLIAKGFDKWSFRKPPSKEK